jgi:hypothetical protein
LWSCRRGLFINRTNHHAKVSSNIHTSAVKIQQSLTVVVTTVVLVICGVVEVLVIEVEVDVVCGTVLEVCL